MSVMKSSLMLASSSVFWMRCVWPAHRWNKGQQGRPTEDKGKLVRISKDFHRCMCQFTYSCTVIQIPTCHSPTVEAVATHPG